LNHAAPVGTARAMAKSPLTPTARERRKLHSLDPVVYVDDRGCEVKFFPVEWPDGRLSFGQAYRNGLPLLLPRHLSDVFFPDVSSLERALRSELESFDRT
jgi:hypothetical protein